MTTEEDTDTKPAAPCKQVNIRLVYSRDARDPDA